ncbi:MAG: hypothetical protein INR63_07450, partial [Actinomycetospora chiangmaiensis]|nr:hypothetical protein [Actinomycetospora chiangmaiensis]
MRYPHTAALSGAAVLLLAVSASLSAQAADLPRQAPPPPPPPALPVFTWTGFYAGVNAGYAFPTGGSGFTDPTYGAVTGGGRSGGFAGGGQIGYNYQFTPGSGFVVGVETDIQGAALAKADAAYLGATPYYSIRPSLDYFGTVRGRVGYAFDRVLVYGTGGFAYGDVNRRTTYYGPNANTTPFFQGNSNGLKTGYAYGGGIEYALPANSFLSFL